MKSFRLWVTAIFLWLPLVVSVALNPGRNGSNIASFSDAKLFVLATCGFMLVVYGLAGLAQPRQLAFAFAKAPLAPARILVMLFALFLGVLALYESYHGLTLG
jgi:hypothetical protein